MNNYKLTRQGVRDLSNLTTHKATEPRAGSVTTTATSPILKLFVSYDCGVHYQASNIGTEEELANIMKKYDREAIRWYAEETTPGSSTVRARWVGVVSRIHNKILDLLQTL